MGRGSCVPRKMLSTLSLSVRCTCTILYILYICILYILYKPMELRMLLMILFFSSLFLSLFFLSLSFSFSLFSQSLLLYLYFLSPLCSFFFSVFSFTPHCKTSSTISIKKNNTKIQRHAQRTPLHVLLLRQVLHSIEYTKTAHSHTYR